MYRNVFDSEGLLWATLLVDVNGLHPGQCNQAVVADEPAEDGVHAIEMGRLVERDEELRAVRAGPFIGHGDHAAGAVAKGGSDLVVECAAPDRLAALGVLRGRMGGGAGLDHEARDEAVEGRLVVVARGTEREEVLRDVSCDWGEPGAPWSWESLPLQFWGRFRRRPRA